MLHAFQSLLWTITVPLSGRVTPTSGSGGPTAGRDHIIDIARSLARTGQATGKRLRPPKRSSLPADDPFLACLAGYANPPAPTY
ncbi:hypothetical protein EMEDMD4_980030 [Sinorhizobium medicae]|uniref:Uncharacterized protein n=1 Tax=Sinorhizobium medicae TaxID=110321 RepID=A0A508XAD5_9HYPH|nr:hypothetical protein EMEDMD4_980030 [Sinorhizobium medicae]